MWRFNSFVWFRHRHHPIPSLEIQQEASSCRSKVCSLLRDLNQTWLTDGREFQLFLVGYIIVSICEIFTVGGFPLDRKVRLVSHATKSPQESRVDRYCRVSQQCILGQ